MRKFDIAAAIRQGGNKRHSVGQSICLHVRGESALWEFQYRDRQTKQLRSTSLGSAKGPEAIGIAEARAARAVFYASLLNGTAPGPAAVAGKSFGEALQAYLATHASAWKGGAAGAEADAYRRLLQLDLAKMPLARIDANAVQDALAPWDRKATQGKVRTKIKSVIDFAKASTYDNGNPWFTGDNPAAFETIGKVLPKAPKAEHHAAMPWADVPAFMAGLAAFDTAASRALRWTILNAARSGETTGATWAEIVTDKNSVTTWEIAGDRMKEGRPHAVPLTAAALALLGERGKPSDLIFFKPTDSKELRGDAMRAFVKDRGCAVHGFRSTFVDWAAENGYPSELREIALAHLVGDATERAYHRSNRLVERREMMEAWAAFATAI